MALLLHHRRCYLTTQLELPNCFGIPDKHHQFMPEKKIRIAALMTAPRYESVWARSIIERALSQSGIPLAVSGGVFYGQCMQRMFNDIVNQNADFILTVDFDSIFTKKHIDRLLGYIVNRSEIDAITAVQPKRGIGTILATRGKEEDLIWDGNPIQVKSAHFGLTVLRVDAIRKVEKPYFCAKPDADGEWIADKIDEDVWFWKQWEKAGNSLYIDPGCRLGHLEEVITVFDDNMQLKHVYPNEWESVSESTVG